MTTLPSEIATQHGLAERWGISPQRVSVLAGKADFPKPFLHTKSGIYYDAVECDHWRSKQLSTTTRKAPK